MAKVESSYSSKLACISGWEGIASVFHIVKILNWGIIKLIKDKLEFKMTEPEMIIVNKENKVAVEDITLLGRPA